MVSFARTVGVREQFCYGLAPASLKVRLRREFGREGNGNVWPGAAVHSSGFIPSIQAEHAVLPWPWPAPRCFVTDRHGCGGDLCVVLSDQSLRRELVGHWHSLRRPDRRGCCSMMPAPLGKAAGNLVSCFNKPLMEYHTTLKGQGGSCNDVNPLALPGAPGEA